MTYILFSIYIVRMLTLHFTLNLLYIYVELVSLGSSLNDIIFVSLGILLQTLHLFLSRWFFSPKMVPNKLMDNFTFSISVF